LFCLFCLKIELLCRRANGNVCAKGGPAYGRFGGIFCLAFIDLLGYETAAFAEKCIEDYCCNVPGNAR